MDTYKLFKLYSFIESFTAFLFSNYQTTKFPSLIIFKFPKPKNNLKNTKSAN